MNADVQLHVFDRKTGLNVLRESFAVVDKQLQDGELVCLTADSENGRRVSIQIRAEVLEDVPATPELLSPLPLGLAVGERTVRLRPL